MILQANAVHIPLADESVDCCVTSPPYWGLRKYDGPMVVWGGGEDCEHEWADAPPRRSRSESDIVNLASKQATMTGSSYNASGGSFCACGAWLGQLGLEPTFELYIDHLMLIFDEVRRVLKKQGTLWVVIADSYSSGTKGSGGQGKSTLGPKQDLQNIGFQKFSPQPFKPNVPPKSLCSIPARFQIAMTDRGWILRNENIWKKNNCMPFSGKDRFTVDFEKVFFFAKSSTALFWTNEKTGQLVTKKPLGKRGVEGEDWEWRECHFCEGKGCKRCKQTGLLKHNLWSGHDYYFEQQFEEHSRYWADETMGGALKPNSVYTIDANAPTAHKRQSKPPQFNPQGRNARTVWEINTVGNPDAHFATFPPGLVERCLKPGCPKDGIVLDPFVGSGTTAVVARRMGLQYIGLDLSMEYCRMSMKNLAQEVLV